MVDPMFNFHHWDKEDWKETTTKRYNVHCRLLQHTDYFNHIVKATQDSEIWCQSLTFFVSTYTYLSTSHARAPSLLYVPISLCQILGDTNWDSYGVGKEMRRIYVAKWVQNNKFLFGVFILFCSIAELEITYHSENMWAQRMLNKGLGMNLLPTLSNVL